MKRFLSVIFVLVVMVTSSGIPHAFADGDIYAYVTVENSVYPVSQGAKWDGKLLDNYKIKIAKGEKAADVVSRAFLECGIQVSGIEDNYVTDIGGVEAMEASMYSGWMLKINDWFVNYGIGEFYVKENDVITFIYSNEFGEDVGSFWGNNSTLVKSIDFTHGLLDKSFNKDVYTYDITLPVYVDKIKITPTAENKNYQVRIYKNANINSENGKYLVEGEQAYENIISGIETGDIPETIGLCHKNSYISVSDGDVISVCCGLDYYNSMNTSEGGTLYTFNVKKVRSKCNIENNTEENKIHITPESLNGENLRVMLACYNENKLVSMKSEMLSCEDIKNGYSVSYSDFCESNNGEIYVFLVNSRLTPASSKLRIK